MTTPEIKVGQIWKEVSSTEGRCIRIEETNSHASIGRRVAAYYLDGRTVWVKWRGAPQILYRNERFNGKRGGYALVEDAS